MGGASIVCLFCHGGWARKAACRNPGGASCCQDSDVYNGVAVGIRDWGMTVNDRVAVGLSREFLL